MFISEVVYYYEEYGDVVSDVDDYDVWNIYCEFGLVLDVFFFWWYLIDVVYLMLMLV